MRPGKLNDTQRKEIQDKYSIDRIGSSTLAREYGVHENSIVKLLKKTVGMRPKKCIPIADEKEFVRLYLDGYSCPEIADIFKNVSSGGVSDALDRNNTKRRTAEEAHRKYAMNENFFDSIDTEEKAYMLGFLYADGCNQMTHHFSVVISLAEYDKDHLLKFARIIYNDEGTATQRVKLYGRARGDTETKEAVLDMCSKHMCLTLNKHGCTPNKSLTLTYPKWMPKALNRHFIRGYFDGDGSIHSVDKAASGCTMVGTQEFLQISKDIMAQLNIASSMHKSDKTNDKNTYTLSISGNRNQQRFLNWIYEGSSIYLDRKYARFLQFKTKIEANDAKTLTGTQGYPVHYLGKNYPDFYKPIVVNGITLDAEAIEAMSDADKKALVPDIFDFFRTIGFHFFTNRNLIGEYDDLVKYVPDITVSASYGNNYCIQLCKYYCKEFFSATSGNSRSIIDVFNDDKLLTYVIENRLLLNWNPKDRKENRFNISYASIVKGSTASGRAPNVSFFRPSVAKLIYLKYSQENDTVYDFSAGWGGRMLGAASCNRKYIGVDPLTIPSITKLKDDLKLENTTLVDGCSETIQLDENSIDFAFSSPPYFDTEIYSQDKTQAYSQGEKYFYNTYWRGTLEKIKLSLKSGKFVAINVKGYPKMVDMAKELFGDTVEEFQLSLNNSNFKTDREKQNHEIIYVFRNDK